MKKSVIFFLFIFFTQSYLCQQKDIILTGKIVDNNNDPLPYVSISILEKSVGTSSNEDGEFSFKLSQQYLFDILSISTIGFKTLKIKVQDFINRENKTIVLEEDVVSLDEITLINPESFVKDAIKNVRKTRYKDGHQLNLLYRRFSSENGLSRFLVEHYLQVYDGDPTYNYFDAIEIKEGRKSADYRFVKKKQNFHAIKIMAQHDPLRSGFNRKDYKWSILDESSYDGEELLVIEGRKRNSKNSFIKLYIGFETKGIYRLETSGLAATYIYKKDKNGKLVLSYHKREFKSKQPISDTTKKLLKLNKNYVDLSYRHEVIVLDVVTVDDKIEVKHNFVKGRDIADYSIKYNKIFWDTINLPPASGFYKANIKELESFYGVPIEVQFNVVNQ